MSRGGEGVGEPGRVERGGGGGREPEGSRAEPLSAGSSPGPFPGGSSPEPLPAGSSAGPFPGGSSAEPLSAGSSAEPVPAGASAEPFPLEARGVQKAYEVAEGRSLEILRGVDLQVRRGEAVAIVGQSGSGKSTLLHILGALDRPTRGHVRLSGDPVEGLGRDALARLRNRRVGFVFQFHHLLREFTAVENAAMPALVGGMNPREARDRAEVLLRAVGLEGRLGHRPWQLSGGEQQRVAVARALVNEPPLLLADEPTGNLDPETSEGLHDLLFRIREDQGLALVLVTHNRELAGRADRILALRSGVLSPDGPRSGVVPETPASAGADEGAQEEETG